MIDLENQLLKEMAKGTRAKELLENEIYIEVMRQMEEKLLHGMRTCPLRDTEGLVSSRLMIELLDKFRKNIEQIASTGKLAADQYEEIQQKKKRKTKVERFL